MQQVQDYLRNYTFKAFNDESKVYEMVLITAISLNEARITMKRNGWELFFPFKIPNLLNNANFETIAEKFIENCIVQPNNELQAIDEYIFNGETDKRLFSAKNYQLVYDFYSAFGLV